MDHQTVLRMDVEPSAFDEGGDEFIVIPVPFAQDGDVLVAESSDVATWAILRRAHPEHF
jgi:hypothetical protein